MNRIILLASMAALFIVLLAACNEDDCPACPEQNVAVGGQVLAYRCGIDDGYNNIGAELRYSAATAQTAYVHFERLGKQTQIIATDSLSSFAASLPQGDYRLIVISDHARPDTFPTVTFASDTMLTLKIVYDYMQEGHTLNCVFYYSTGDSLGLEAEKAILDTLNAAVGGMLIPDEAERAVSSPGPYVGVTVYYDVPVQPDIEIWRAYDATREEITENSGKYPGSFYTDPGHYICMM